MLIISHRGFWKHPSEKNSLAAFERSFQHGLGVELDLRDAFVQLVISHDPPLPGTLSFELLLRRHHELAPQAPLALNIKADGLQTLLTNALRQHGVQDYFVFDHQANGKRACLVSPELHGRDHRPFWSRLRSMTHVRQNELLLCTDHPESAREFFHE